MGNNITEPERGGGNGSVYRVKMDQCGKMVEDNLRAFIVHTDGWEYQSPSYVTVYGTGYRWGVDV